MECAGDVRNVMPIAAPQPTSSDEANVRAADPFALFAAHVNPRFAQVLRLIGFDKRWQRALGPYLWDDKGDLYLDLLAGYGVFNVGRNHPRICDALISHIASEAPSLI